VTSGLLPIELTPIIEHCPTDTQLKVAWMGNPPWNGVRTYEVVSCGRAWNKYIQVDSKGLLYPLPSPIELSVGILWANAPGPDWDAKSYKTSVVKDPAGTLILVEEPNSFDAAGNIWPSVCMGPLYAPGTTDPFPEMHQLQYPPPVPSESGGAVNEGWQTYRAHGNRFNYLFVDNHVAALKIEQTIGTGTTNAPKGMWTVAPGD
jgi:prepilin-type processing-associated H-X9-DG protein